MSETLTLKLSLAYETEQEKVTLGRVAELECPDAAIGNRLKTLEIFRFPEEGEGNSATRYAVSVIEIYRKIHEIYPNLAINNIGETDIVIKKKSAKRRHPARQAAKIVFVCLTIFFGAAFAIMAFNNDVSVGVMFSRIYNLITGKDSEGTTIVHVMYSVGLAVGILVFYNHFGSRKLTTDPTPVQIEMNTYEEDVNHTIIANGAE
ncbi:MAG: stage V sporulation protein AA [Lachnospiraceae bacterium]|nr:stage V sporulation protein AA [Lachnospiraceae bacterium]